MYIKIGVYGILLSLISSSLLYCNPLDSYGYRSKNEIKAHRKLEGTKVDKKHEIYSKSIKTKVGKILSRKGNNNHSSIVANIDRIKSKINSTLNHKNTLSYKKGIRKQNDLSKYDLKKLKSIVNKNGNSVSNKSKSRLKREFKKNKKTILRKKSTVYSKKKRVVKPRRTKRTYKR